MKRDISGDFQEYLNDHRDNLTDSQIDDFYDRFLDLRDEVEEVAACQHKTVEPTIDPKQNRQGLDHVLAAVANGGEKYRGRCNDCGATVTVKLTMEVDDAQ
jgi:hypothetical protein